MCQISSRSEWNQSSTVEAKILPNVSYIPIARSPTTPSRSIERPPILPMNRMHEVMAIGPPCAPVTSWRTDSGPISSIASTTASATSVRASSHVIRFQRPEPLSPTRLSG